MIFVPRRTFSLKLWPRRRGMTLVEVMIALLVFSLISIGLTAAVIQMRKDSEGAVAQVIADSMAEGIMNQIRQAGYANLIANPTVDVRLLQKDPNANRATVTLLTGNAGLPFKQQVARPETPIYVDDRDDANHLVVVLNQDFYTLLRPNVDVAGVLVDVPFNQGNDGAGQQIRPARYMPLVVNLTRTVDVANRCVTIVLRYRWAKPDMPGSFYQMRELRTVVSAAKIF